MTIEVHVDQMWQVDRAPRVGALRLASARLGGLPAVAAAVRVDPSVDVTTASALLQACVGVRLVWHPSTAALIEAASGTPTSPVTYALTAGGPGVRALASQLHPHVWVTPTTPAGEPAQAQDVAHLLGCDISDVGSMPGPARAGRSPGPGRIHLTRRGRAVTLRLGCDALEVPDPGRAGLKITTGRTTRLTPPQVGQAVAALTKASLVVVDADVPGRLADLGWVVDRRLLLRPAPGAPGWARVDAGPLVTSSLPPVLPAADAVTGVRPSRSQVAVAVDYLVLAAAGYATAPAQQHATIPGVALRAWQEKFIGRYLAGTYGLLNALPPGSGKTACVAGAMATAATRCTGRPHRALVVAPVTLLTQWCQELGVFHPGATPVVLSTEADLPRAARALKLPTPVVLVTSPAMVAQHAEWFADVHVDDLAVDEGTYLRGDSAQTRALWQVRRASARAVVLTGTADSAADGTVEALVHFITGRTDLFAGPVEAALADMDVLDRAGAWVFGGGHDVLAALPGAQASTTPLDPCTATQLVQDVARARVGDLLHSAGTGTQMRRAATRARTELAGWRTGLACPAALCAGTSALGRQVLACVAPHVVPTSAAELARLVPALVGAKVTWVRRWVLQGRDAGQQSLVFADSIPTLQVLADQLTLADPHLRVGVLSGAVRPPARARMVANFTGGGLDVLLVAGAGQLGLNLQAASRVAHLDVPASAGSLLQRSARAARMGSAHTSIDVAVPLVTGTADEVWWSHAGGARAAVDIIGLARELTGAVPVERSDGRS